MNARALLKELGRYVYLTFRFRRALLVALVVLCVVPGAFVKDLPMMLRTTYAYGWSFLLWVSFCGYVGVLRDSIMALPTMLFGRRRLTRYYSPKLLRLAESMGIKRQPKVFLTEAPRITSAFTNALTGTVYLPSSWLTEYPENELLSILAHELGHTKTRLRFWLELLAALGMVLVAAFALAFQTAVIIAQAFELALALLLLTLVSWANEYRADKESARALGPEGMISVLEQLETKFGGDEGSETHPPLRRRIERLMRLFEQNPARNLHP